MPHAGTYPPDLSHCPHELLQLYDALSIAAEEAVAAGTPGSAAASARLKALNPETCLGSSSSGGGAAAAAAPAGSSKPSGSSSSKAARAGEDADAAAAAAASGSYSLVRRDVVKAWERKLVAEVVGWCLDGPAWERCILGVQHRLGSAVDEASALMLKEWAETCPSMGPTGVSYQVRPALWLCSCGHTYSTGQGP